MNRKRKSSAHRSPSPSNASLSSSHQRQRDEWNKSSSSLDRVDSIEQQITPPFSGTSVEIDFDLYHHDRHDRPLSDSIRVWDEPTSQQQKMSSTSALLNNIGNELQTPRFDPLMPDFEDMDFSDIDHNTLENDGASLGMTFPQFIGSPSSRTSTADQQQQKHPHTTRLVDNSPSITASSHHSSGLNRAASTSHPLGNDIKFWTAQLEELSRKSYKCPIPLDEMLHHSSQLLPRVTEALRLLPSANPASSSATHLILILICLTHAITLFEQCVPFIICGLAINGSSSSLSLHLGAFQIDRDIQQALQMHVVGKELSTILRLSKLIKQMLLQPDWNDGLKRTHNLLLEDLQVRTKTLAYQIKQKWSSARRPPL